MQESTIASSPSAIMTHLIDLNDDCLLHISCFLNIYELLQLANVSNRLRTITERSLQKIQFLELTDGILSRISPNQVRYILSHAGCRLKAIGLADLQSSNTIAQYVGLIPALLPNIEELNLEWIDGIPLKTFHALFQACRALKSLKIFECNITDEVCALMYLLPSLQRLDLSENRLITGKYLKKLSKIVDLKLSCCNIQAKHFREICDAMQLRMLDIRHCTMLFQDSFECLVQTQKQLEFIHVSNYPCGEANVVAQLVGLKHVAISYPPGEFPTGLVKDLVRYKKNSLESVEIYWRHFSNSAVKDKLLLLENLRQLVVLDAWTFGEEDLKSVALAFPFLAAFHCSGVHHLSSKALRKFAKRTKNLEELSVIHHEYFPDVLYYKLLENMWRKENGWSLLASMTQIHFTGSFLCK